MIKKDYARISVIAATGVGILGYAYLTPPARNSSVLDGLSVMDGLPPDLAMYAERFFLAFLLLGVLPGLCLLLWRHAPARVGLSLDVRPLKPIHLLACAAVGVIIGAVGFLLGGLESFYPYASSLPELVGQHGWIVFVAHSAAYLVLFYLPWEFLFRGVLVFSFVEESDVGHWPRSGPVLAVVCLQAIPSALLHFGHPFTESLAALPLGIVLGMMALRTGSILPGLVGHAVTGIALDLFLVAKALG